ncbi:MAG: ATP-binding cassette domain-containing protein [Aquabacterium sp.]|nr:ATP-binding cassette domain-containing protein [Aquabacterium sp.]
MSSAAASVIEARGLQVSAGAQVLLRDVGLRITAGERVALVGHNGAGKSTLLRALTGFAGLGRITRGQLRVLDTDLATARPGDTLRHLRSRVAQVHQGLHLVGRLSALDNVLIGGAGRHHSVWTWLRRWPAAEQRAAQAALVRVGLGGAAHRRTDTLSGGERQKVAIARALHQGAPLLLADEPTASLDADAADAVAGLLAAVAAERQATLVCVVHDLDLLPRLAERAIALRRGVVVADVAVDAHTPAQLRGLLK